MFLNPILETYHQLLSNYGPQGWWPLSDLNGYHPKDYSYPKTPSQQFEISIGAILTQNTAWKNVEKALMNLKNNNALNPIQLDQLEEETLKTLIKPSGYYNQKAKKLKKFTQFFINLKGKTPTRKDLLEVWGIGPETADSILLYAYQYPIFVVDAYTKRFCQNQGWIKKEATYQTIQTLFEENLPKNTNLFQEYHALIVTHQKQCS